MNAATPQAPSTWTPEFDALVMALPPSHESWRARRTAIVEALAGFTPDAHPLAASLERCIEILRTRAAAVGGESTDHGVPAPHVEQPVAAPESTPAPETEVEAETDRADVSARKAAAVSGWRPAERALYEDLLALFELGDTLGAMTSLERLWMLSPDAADLKAFLTKNQNLLIGLYREALGSMDRVPVPRKDRAPVRVPAGRPSLMMDVLRLCDGHRSLRTIAKKSGIDELATLLTVSHLVRSGFVELA
jgi:hypothetical protein